MSNAIGSRLVRSLACTFALTLALAAPVQAKQAQPSINRFPVPQTASPQLQKFIGQKPLLWYWNARPRTGSQWKPLVAKVEKETLPLVKALEQKLGVASRPSVLGGVPVFELVPAALDPGFKDCVLLHFHGGGYLFNPGESGAGEGVLMAALSGVRVVSVDYRMPPDHPYPAALDDILAVYREVLKTHPASRIGVFGSSTGGGLTLALCLRAREEGLPQPFAIAPGSPWTDMSETGDTYVTHKGHDNVLVGYEWWLKAAAQSYADGRDLKDPHLSPVYADVSGFPPAFFTTGTRDLFLSCTARMHVKFKEAGIPAEMLVFEGMSHVQYLFDPDMPEARLHFAELARFFKRHLH